MRSDDQLIFSTIAEWSKREIGFALATVVAVRGSTYRGLAARQLVAADGTSLGTVSGGCLDREVTEVASQVRASGRPTVVEFDLTADDEAIWGWGIGCNGATELLVEPESSALQLASIMAAGAPAVLHGLSGEKTGTHRPVALDDPLWEAEAERARSEGRHRRVSQGGEDYLLEVVASRPRLIVCGAGHDAVPLVKLGSDLGFEVTVVDDRRQFLSPDRFPEAALLVQCSPPELANHVSLDPTTSVVIMSHNYERDLGFLGSILGHPVVYVGCLGPGERLERLLKDVNAQGRAISEDDLRRLYGPAGLDLGAEGPTEIAWSVLSEIMAVRRHAEGGPLVHKKGPAQLRRLP